MATLFEGWLIGEDVASLRAIAQQLQTEILRIEMLLSRHDPAASLARLNREAAHRLVKVERELLAVLKDCLEWYQKTEGHFDIGFHSKANKHVGLSNRFCLYPSTSQVKFNDPSLRLDLGGYGKGYALDCLGKLLVSYGIKNFLLHGGKSSFLAKGKTRSGSNWEVNIGEGAEIHIFQIEKGLSYSSVFHAKDTTSDIIHAPTGNPLIDPRSCAVWANTALEAEVWSTALLAMNKEKGHASIEGKTADIKVKFFESQTYES